ncbi:hypothetical protein OG592_43035 (plasmid) [Streptomyces avidinii]|uniref:hypothetical protein n=1 Tax=Streptomyces avidinii TaxID=1895 RepID=UPI002F90A434|nr:hypothetical protein OG592_43035 [Streptomyces avidinii]
MPKNQPTAAKRARTAARSGAKYTTALRAAGPLSPYLPIVDEATLTDDELLVVDHLRVLAAADWVLLVHVATPDQDVIEAEQRVRAESRRPQWQRWAIVQPAVDGYVLREVLHGPNSSRYHLGNRAPRVPVPVRTEGDIVTFVAMPHWAREDRGRWIWAQTGWPVDSPGRIVSAGNSLARL